MKSQKRVIKFITSILLAIVVFFNMNINYTVKADDNSNKEQTETNKEKEISKVQNPAESNIKETNHEKYVNNDLLVFFKDDVKTDDIDKVIKSVNGTIVGQVTSVNEYQVKVKESTLDDLNNMVSNIKKNYDDYVAFASVDYISESTSITPNDPWGNDTVWDEKNVSGKNWGLEAIQAQSAWQYNNIFDESCNKVNLGVVDGGFDTTAEDFPDSYEKFSDTVDDLPFNHGTFVTSIIAAKANNNKGITGIVWNPGKIYLASAASSNYGSLTLAGLTKGLSDVVSNGANVVNCSFGGEDLEKTQSTVAAFFMAKMLNVGHDFIIVQASGNDTEDAKYNGWFAGISDNDLNMAKSLYNVDSEDIKDRIITVGAAEEETDGSYMQAHYSNTGKSVDICAPGSNIYSQEAGNNYASGNGTSYAAPHVAGVTELTWRANPKLTGKEVRNIVCDKNNTIYEVPAYTNCTDKISLRMVNAKLSVENALQTRNDLVTLYLNSDSESSINYKLSQDKEKTIVMNDNIDNNGYNKSITIPANDCKYISAKIKADGKWYDNNGEDFKLYPGAYALEDGKLIKVNDKFQGLRVNDFSTDEGYETTVSDSIKLKADAVNIQGSCNYAFSVIDSNGNETKIKDYSSDNTASWSAAAVGDYTLSAKVKDDRGYEVTKEMKFKVIPKATVKDLYISPSTYGAVGKETKISISVNGGKGSPKCKFIAVGGDYDYGSKSIVFDSTSSQSGTWTPEKTGTYSILCDVTDESGVTNRYKLCDYKVVQDPDYKFKINSFSSSKESEIEVGEDILFNFNFLGGPNNDQYVYASLDAVNEDGTKVNIACKDYEANKLNTIKWAPTKSGKWTMTLTLDRSSIYSDSKSININVNEYKKPIQANTTTIYYKGYDSPYIHYAVNNENWTKAPGIKMTETNEMSGYTHKYVIDLGNSDNVSVCFNDGNGNWDSNNGKNYKFNSGVYTYSSGNATKVAENNSNFAVSYFKGDTEGTITAGQAVNFKADVINATGNVKYTFVAIDQNGNEDTLNFNNERCAYWMPRTPGNYNIKVTAVDEAGNSDSREMSYVVNDEVKIKSFIMNTDSPVLVNTPVTFTINATGGTGKFKYSFEVYNGQDLVTEKESNNNSFTFTPTISGNYTVKYTAEDECDSHDYNIERFVVKDTEKDPLVLYQINQSNNGYIIKDEGVSFDISLASYGVGKVKYSAYAICTDGTKDDIAVDSDSNVLNWKPSKSGSWMIFINVNDESGQKIYNQMNEKVIDKINNMATIYYNAATFGFDDVYINYKIGDGAWTSTPGVKMEKTDELEGYTHKIVIPIGEETKLTCCFNNGKGTWDNNDSKDYVVTSPYVGISDKTCEGVTAINSLEVNKVIINDGSMNNVYLGDTVKVTTKAAGAIGKCKYTVVARNYDDGKIDVISKESEDSSASWVPSEKGYWTITVLVEDEEGNCIKNSDYGVDVY